jgi:hypothetical protein
VQGFLGVVDLDRYRLLGEDWSGVDAGIDEMHGAAGNRDAVCQGICDCMRTRETRKQSRMSIHNPIRELGEYFRAEDAHEPSADDPIRVVCGDCDGKFGIPLRAI